MAARSFYLPFQAAVKPTNVGAPGAKYYFYVAGSTTLQAIYSNSAMTTRLANPVIADGAGRIPAVYMSDALTWKLYITDKNGTALYTRDPYIPGAAPDAADLEPYQTAAESAAATAAADAAAASLSQTAAAASAAVASSAQAGVIAALGGASIGSVSLNAASRVALKALNTSTGFPAIFDGYVWEVVTYASVSALVAADTPEGIYCRSTYDTAKVWVRQFDGPAQATWFGVSTSETAANNTTYFTAALALLKLLAVTGYGNGGSIGLHTNAGHYTFNNTLSPSHQVEISGDFTGSGGGTVFEWTANVHGFEVLGGGNGNGSVIRNLYLIGTNAGTSKHAINQTGNLTVDCVSFKSWSGDGVHADSTTGGLSGSVYRKLNAESVGWTLYITGPDSNGCLLEDISAGDNRFGGIFDSSGIGNTCFGGVINRCGKTASFVTRCHSGGHIYAVAYGQEVGASTNAPSGTTASNTWWTYAEEGSADATQPAWTSGLTWYFSAPLCVEPADGNVRSIFVGMYVEDGLNPIILSDPSQILGGQILVPVYNQFGTAHGGYLYADRYYAKFNNGISTVGDALIGADLYLAGVLAINSARAAALTSVASTGVVSSSSATAGIGYATGAGGTSTQATSKSTAATALNKACGQVTMNNAALAAGTVVSFTMANSAIGATDLISVNHVSGGTIGAYTVEAVASAGTITFYVRNNTAGSLGEALVLRYAKINGVTS